MKSKQPVNERGIAPESLNFGKYENERESVTTERERKLDSMLPRLFGKAQHTHTYLSIYLRLLMKVQP